MLHEFSAVQNLTFCKEVSYFFFFFFFQVTMYLIFACSTKKFYILEPGPIFLTFTSVSVINTTCNFLWCPYSSVFLFIWQGFLQISMHNPSTTNARPFVKLLPSREQLCLSPHLTDCHTFFILSLNFPLHEFIL